MDLSKEEIELILGWWDYVDAGDGDEPTEETALAKKLQDFVKEGE